MKRVRKTILNNSIYFDERNELVFFDRITRKGFYVDNKNITAFNVWSSRYTIIICTLLLLYSYFENIRLTIFSGITMAIFSEYMFRVKFLNSLEKVKNFNLYNFRSVKKIDVNYKRKDIQITKAITLLCLSILFFVNTYQRNYVGTLKIISYIIGLLFGVYFIHYAYSLKINKY